MTQAGLAREAGVSAGHVSHLEHGELARHGLVVELAAFLKVEPEDLLR